MKLAQPCRSPVIPGAGARGVIRATCRMRSSVEWIPAPSQPPCLATVRVTRGSRTHHLPYLARPGAGPSVLFVHGLGGSKENFLWAAQSPDLAHCHLVMFDTPGTGLARFHPEDGLDVSALADLTQLVADALVPGSYFLAGASMGGLITLLQMRRHGAERIRGYINIEGNLAAEDCMFSRRAIPHSLEAFQGEVFAQVIQEMRRAPYAGDRIIANNLALNVDVRAYHAYCFETVAEHCSRRYVEVLRRRPVQAAPQVSISAARSLAEILLTLRDSRALLRHEIASIADGELDSPCRGDMSLRDFVLMIIRHEAWHAGQIVVIRRLFRSQA